jgi:hypothetical protein
MGLPLKPVFPNRPPANTVTPLGCEPRRGIGAYACGSRWRKYLTNVCPGPTLKMQQVFACAVAHRAEILRYAQNDNKRLLKMT